MMAMSYMTLVPITLPPIIRLLTSKKERAVAREEFSVGPEAEKNFLPLLSF